MINKLISLVILTLFLLIGYSYSDNQFIYPKKKPSIFKEKNNTINQQVQNNLPQRKPIIQSDKSPQKKVIEREKIKEKKDTQKSEDTKKIEEKTKMGFIFPQKKPSVYKASSKEVKKSSILKQKDFEQAKKTIEFIKQKNGIVL